MSSKLPQRSGRPPERDGVHSRGSNTTFVYEIRTERKLGGVAGALLGVLFFAGIVTFLVIGAITFTIALWLACGVVVLGLVVAFFRRLFRPGGDRGTGAGPR
jgi:hypothetical protein